MMPGITGYELCRRLRANPRTAHVKIVFFTARSQPIDEQAGMDAGADLFLSKPVMPDALVKHIHTLLAEAEREEKERVAMADAEQETQAEPPAKPQGRLVACYSPHAGVGVTTLSANLAVAFAVSLRRQIPLVELHALQGHMLPAFGFPRDPHKGNLAATGPKLSWDTLQLHLVDHSSGVRILPAPPPSHAVLPAFSERAVSLLREQFPLTIVDAGRGLDDRVKPVLLSADLILMLTTPEVPAARSMLQALQTLQTLKYPSQQVVLVVNNVQPKAEIPVEELAEAAKRPIFAVIPHEPAMADTFRTGRPLLAVEPRSAASQAIGRMTMQMSRGFRLSQGAG
jgi:pilus assembly protein CpaE